MQRGQRVIGGKVYQLGGRTTGINAKVVAKAEANTKRANGKQVRLIKLAEGDYLIYEI